MGRIIEGVRTRTVRLRQHAPDAGYLGFQVAISDAAAMTSGLTGTSRAQSPLAAFGRSIGIRAPEQLLALVKSGDVHAILERHAVTQREMWWISERSIAAIHARCMPLTSIQKEPDPQRNLSRSILRHAGAAPYSSGKGGSGSIYLRSRAEPELRKDGRITC